MRHGILSCVVASCLCLSASGQSSQPVKPATNGGDFSTATTPLVKVPEGVILVKGAWASASDSVTPVPEDNSFTNSVLSNPYFGMSYALPQGWAKGYDGPPPSDSGRYVLAQLRSEDLHKDSHKTATRGSILITAQDMFFNPLPANNAPQLVNYMKDNLQADYKLEEPPMPTKIGGRRFTFFAYWSPVAELHWYVLATEIRCHVVEIVLTSRDTKLLASSLLDLDKMTLPAEAGPTNSTGGGTFPVCIKDYASEGNVMARVDPVFTEHRVNPVPVRIVIDKQGKVKHIHFLSAFPDQAKAVTDALFQWRFKPYVQNGQAVEVETGIMFGRAPRPASPARTASVATE
jgi:hypothetical protein